MSRSSSASLKARIAVRCWPRDAKPGQVTAGQVERQVVAVRADHGRAVPDLLLGRLDEAPCQSVARRLAGRARARSSRSGASSAAGRRLVGRDLACAPPPAVPRAARAARAGPPRPTARVEEGLVPEPQLVARRLLLADRAQQAVALLERPAVRAQIVGIGRGSARRPACRAPHAGAMASRRRAASPRARTARSADSDRVRSLAGRRR